VTRPTPDECGHVDEIRTDEIGDTNVIIFKQEEEGGAIATIVIRGATENIMDDVERAIDDGVNTFKALTKDNRLVPGGGATEMDLAKSLTSHAETCPGLEQYAITKFAEALEVVPRALAENSGVKATEVVSQLYVAHQQGQKTVGFDIEKEAAGVTDMVEKKIFDLYVTKYWALKFATMAANTVLKVDQIIMAKQAGGPKPKENKDWDED